MMAVVCYDVCTKDAAGSARLRKGARLCVSYGQRVQNSVFEVDVGYGDFLKLKHGLLKIIDKDLDSIRIYVLGNQWKPKIEHYGAKQGYDPEGFLMV